MRVTVLLFARLRDLAGRSEWACQVPAGSSVSDVWRELAAAHPEIAPFSSSVSAAVNANFARMSSAIHDGDEIAFLPPVSGGAGRG
jgi:molybdopterin converting factor subunit 1